MKPESPPRGAIFFHLRKSLAFASPNANLRRVLETVTLRAAQWLICCWARVRVYVCMCVCVRVCVCVRGLCGWLVGGLGGGLAGGLAGWLACWLAGWVVGVAVGGLLCACVM